MKGSTLTLHPEEEQLLAYIDGELPAPVASQVRSHLEACWQCRAALEGLQQTVSECVHYRTNVLQRHLPAPPAPWTDIHHKFDEIDASVEPVFFDRLARLLKSPFDSAMRRWALAAVALLLLLGLFYRYNHAPSVQASELLRRAVAEAKLHPGRPARIQVRARGRRVNRPAVFFQRAALTSADDETLNSVQAMFLRAHYDWNDPLSAQSFAAWRNQLADKRDRVDQEIGSYRVETSSPSSELRQAILTLRTPDLQPFEARFQFSSDEWVEITELAGDSTTNAGDAAEDGNRAPTASTPLGLNSSGRQPSASAQTASIGDELHVVATLHDLGADLGDPIEVSRSGSDVLVSGVGIAPRRQQAITNALSAKANVVVRFSEASAAGAQPQPVSGNETGARTDAGQLQTGLAERAGGRPNLDQLATQVLDTSESMMARAYALRRLAEEFPAGAEPDLNGADRQLLERLRREHTTAMRQAAAEINRALESILAGTPADNPAIPEDAVSGSWQAATEELFQSARKLDKLLGVMFGAAPSETKGDQLRQLKTGLAQLRNTLEIYERSNR